MQTQALSVVAAEKTETVIALGRYFLKCPKLAFFWISYTSTIDINFSNFNFSLVFMESNIKYWYDFSQFLNNFVNILYHFTGGCWIWLQWSWVTRPYWFRIWLLCSRLGPSPNTFTRKSWQSDCICRYFFLFL